MGSAHKSNHRETCRACNKFTPLSACRVALGCCAGIGSRQCWGATSLSSTDASEGARLTTIESGFLLRLDPNRVRMRATSRTWLREQRLRPELDAVLADRVAGYDDLPRLEPTSWVVTETPRLYPAWLITRTTTAEADLGRHRFPRRHCRLQSVPHGSAARRRPRTRPVRPRPVGGRATGAWRLRVCSTAAPAHHFRDQSHRTRCPGALPTAVLIHSQLSPCATDGSDHATSG